MFLILFILWYCIDDTLATTLNNPGIGHVSWWIVLLIAVCIDLLFSNKD